MHLFDDAIRSKISLISKNINSIRLVVGVSGGCDSLVLLHALKKQNIAVFAAHVNYKTRGTDSDKDEDLVRNTCTALDIPLEVKKVTPDDWQAGNFQNAARQIRFDFFQQQILTHDCLGVALGHHQNDQIETILLKWLRASGTHALRGMLPWDPQTRIFRPLLDLSRIEIESYAEQQTIHYRHDATNNKDDYARNWLRNVFSKKLDKLIPGWHSNIIKQAIRASAQTEINRFFLNETLLDDKYTLKLSRFKQLSPEAQHIILASWLSDADINPTEGQLGQIRELTASQPGSHTQLNHNTKVWRNRHSLKLSINETHNSSDYSFFSEKLPVTLDYNDLSTETPAEIILSSTWKVNLSLQNDTPADLVNIPTRPTENLNHSETNFNRTLAQQARKGVYYLTADGLNFPLTIRRWSAGDRFNPFGLAGTRKVSDYLTDRQIRPDQKKDALVITGFDGKILAVIFPHSTQQGLFVGISGDGKLSASTKNIIRITVNAPS
jgi:tRNA(Ile)-lysidine synthase